MIGWFVRNPIAANLLMLLIIGAGLLSLPQLRQITYPDVALDIMGAAGQLKVDTEDAPLAGRFEGAYRCTVVETIGGGASEIQKNIIARRKLGLPKNF